MKIQLNSIIILNYSLGEFIYFGTNFYLKILFVSIRKVKKYYKYILYQWRNQAVLDLGPDPSQVVMNGKILYGISVNYYLKIF